MIPAGRETPPAAASDRIKRISGCYLRFQPRDFRHNILQICTVRDTPHDHTDADWTARTADVEKHDGCKDE